MTGQINEFVIKAYEDAFWAYDKQMSENALAGGDKDPWALFTRYITKTFGMSIVFNSAVEEILIRTLRKAEAQKSPE